MPTKKPAHHAVGGSLCCSFCGRTQREVAKLIAGPTVYICDQCTGLCADICREEGLGITTECAEAVDLATRTETAAALRRVAATYEDEVRRLRARADELVPVPADASQAACEGQRPVTDLADERVDITEAGRAALARAGVAP